MGEIESQLSNIDEIKDAVVLAKEEGKGNGEKYLCAYIVTPGTASIDLSEIRKKLSKNLPGYMIPSYFVQLEEIPLTSNGKVNRKVLPEPEIVTGDDYAPPSNDAEKKLVKIWQEVLDIERIGIDDIFFEIGGDSIKAIQVSARVQKYGFKLRVADLMANPTVRQSAKCLGRIDRDRLPGQGIVEGRVPLTPIQEWFFSSNSPASAGRLWGHFNQAVMIYRDTGFDEGILKALFTHIVTHHDALRMVYTFEKNQILQWNRGMEEPLDVLVELRVIDLKGSLNPAVEIEKGANRIQRSIDLKRGPLVKLGLFKTTGGDHLLMVIHHLVVDGVSWRILLEDIAHGYSLLEKNETLQSPGKTDSFRYWAQKQVEYSESDALLKELEYWKVVETSDIPLLSKDHESTGKILVMGRSEVISIPLDETDTQSLLKEVNQAYHTEINDILLTALGLAVKEWQGKEKVAVTLEGHGRETIVEDVDISRTVGWFTSQFPVVLDMSRTRDISYPIKYVKETLRKIPNKGIGYGILRYLTPPAKREGLRFEREPEISFNYLGQFSQENREKSLKVSNMSTGDSMSPHMERTHSLAINGIISEGKLRLDVIYSKDEYKRSTIKKLADCFRRHLKDIIKHCSGKEEKELTPSDMDYSQLTIDTLDRLKDEIGGIQNVYKLSPMQEGMLFHSLLHKESHAYVEQIVFSIEGEDDRIILERSFNILIEQYDIFRTVFITEGLDEPLQIVLNERAYEMPFEDLPVTDQQQYLEAFIKEDRSRGLNLSNDLLMRIFLFKTGEDSYRLVWTSHHILLDGWCMGIVFKEWVRIYEYLKKGESPSLKPPPQYGNYIKWLQQQDKSRGLNYYEKYLEGYEHTAVIPTFGKSKHDVTNGKYQPGDYGFALDDRLSNRLRDTAKKLRVTVNTLFQTIWGILLRRYNHTDDVVFGTVVSGRSSEIEGIEDMVGLFINTVPVRIRIDSGSFSRLVETLHRDTLESKGYEYLPLAEIQANSAPKGNLIDHIIVFENYPLQEVVKEIRIEESCGFYVDGIDSFEQTNYNFNVRVVPRKTIEVVFSYNSLVYERAFIENIGQHLQQAMKQVSDNPDKAVKEIEIITKEEKQRILYDFSDTKGEYFGGLPHMGIPIANHRVYIVDKDMNLQPIGIPGELCIEGEGLAVEYLNNPELTKKTAAQDEKIYKTGDLARWLPDGSIELLGRIQHPVQVGGYRIEPGEIKSRILLEPDEDFVGPRDELEEAVAGIWSKVLEIKKELIGIDSNFFELGGHSLKATGLVSRIHRDLDVKLPLAEVFRTSTVRGLAEAIKRVSGVQGMGIESIEDENLVFLRKGTRSEEHLFLVHPGSGGVEGYIEFCNRLSPEINCWGLKAGPLDNYAPRNIAVGELAQKYITKIKKAQAKGPFRIAGWSIGGTIAFEMVKQREQLEEEVRLLAMFDSSPPGLELVNGVDEFTLESELEWVIDYLEDEEIKQKLKRVSDICQLWSLIVNYLEEGRFDLEMPRKSIPENIAKTIPNFEQQGIKELIYYLNLAGHYPMPGKLIYLPAKSKQNSFSLASAGQRCKIKKIGPTIAKNQ